MELLDPLDAAMMTGELLLNPIHVAAVLILTPPGDAGPDYVGELYRRTLAGRHRVDPRLRRHPQLGVRTRGVWAWHTADDVEVSRHCRRVRLAGGGSGELWRVISDLHAEPLDRARPMWMFYLIDGLEDGRFALYIKVHHTVVDGVAGMQMITDRLSPDPHDRSLPPFYAQLPGAPPDPAARRRPVPDPLRLLRGLWGAATAGLTLAGRVVPAVGAVSRAALPFRAPHTRFNGRLGDRRAVAAGSWPRSRIQAVQAAAGVSANDVVTAVVGGVLRSWLLERGELPDRSLVAACPITARREGATDLRANVFGIWLCPLGTDLPDPAARLALVHRSMTRGKREVADRGSGLSLLSFAPSIAATVLAPVVPLLPRLGTGYNLPLSNVPGPRTEVFWNGARVDEIYPVSTIFDGQVLNVTVCSYADKIGFGYVADGEVLPDIDALLELTERCLTELETAVAEPAAAR